MSDSPYHRYRVRKIVSREEVAYVEAPSAQAVEAAIIGNKIAFGGPNYEAEKAIEFRIERLDRLNPDETQQKI